MTLTINAKVSGAVATAGFEYCCDAPGGTILLNNAANDFGGNIAFNTAGTVAGSVFGNQGVASSLGKGTSVLFNVAGRGSNTPARATPPTASSTSSRAASWTSRAPAR